MTNKTNYAKQKAENCKMPNKHPYENAGIGDLKVETKTPDLINIIQSISNVADNINECANYYTTLLGRLSSEHSTIGKENCPSASPICVLTALRRILITLTEVEDQIRENNRTFNQLV